MTTRTLTLPADIDALVEKHVRAGAYQDAEALIADAVRAFVADVEPADDIEALRALVAESLADTAPSIPAEDVWASLEAQRARRARS